MYWSLFFNHFTNQTNEKKHITTTAPFYPYGVFAEKVEFRRVH